MARGQYIRQDEADLISEMWARGISNREIAETTGTPIGTVREIVAGRYRPCRSTGMDYMPTPDQIRAACAEIQAGWTEDERERRTCRAYLPQRWEPVVCRAGES